MKPFLRALTTREPQGVVSSIMDAFPLRVCAAPATLADAAVPGAGSRWTRINARHIQNSSASPEASRCQASDCAHEQHHCDDRTQCHSNAKRVDGKPIIKI